MTGASVQAPVDDLIRNSLVWDAHAGVFPDARNDLGFLESWRRHCVDYLSINVGFDVLHWEETLNVLAAYRRWILSHPEQYSLAETMQDVTEAKANGKLAIAFDIEGMNALNGNIDLVGVYHALGVRQMLFAYNLGNAAAGGCHDADVGHAGPAEIPALMAALRDRGFSDDELRGILGGNFQRVAAAVWRT